MSFKLSRRDGSVVPTITVKMSINMNNPDQLEIDLLEAAHALSVNKDVTEEMRSIGRYLKPLMSGFCEALRQHNASGQPNAAFVNTMMNFATMTIAMSMNAAVKTAKLDATLAEVLHGLTEGITASVKGAKRTEELPVDAGSFDSLLAKFLAKHTKGEQA